MDTYDNKAVGKRLAVAREKAGFSTATEAAEALGMKYPTYAGHENGSRGVVRAAQRYARRYHVSLDWLLRGTGPGPGEAQPDAETAQLRAALLAYGVDGSDLRRVLAIIDGFVDDFSDETPEQTLRDDQSEPSNPLRAKAPSE